MFESFYGKVRASEICTRHKPQMSEITTSNECTYFQSVLYIGYLVLGHNSIIYYLDTPLT